MDVLRSRRLVRTLGLVLLVLLVGCGGAGEAGSSSDADGPPAADAAAGVDLALGETGGGADLLPPRRCETSADCEAAFGDLSPCELVVCDLASGTCQRKARVDRAPCDDGDPCTAGSACFEGRCVPGPVQDCDDGNPCTLDRCDGAGGCLHEVALAGGVCDDGQDCTTEDRCDGVGGCVGTPGEGCPACENDSDCAGLTGFFDRCQGLPRCLEGRCGLAPGTGVLCDTSGDGPCARSQCDPATGDCVRVPLADALPCDDGDPCTDGDTCLAGLCRGQAGACPCATDGDCAPFDDVDPCNGVQRCQAGACHLDPETAVVCRGEDAGPCRRERCQPATGRCEPEDRAEAVSCRGADACVQGARCWQGECGGGWPRSCDDGNPCTSDRCEPDSGCAHAALAGACEDGDACTVGDSCQAGRCVPGPALDCDDGNDCTADRCDAVEGCLSTPLDGAPCDDGDPCTGAPSDPDRCVEGSCRPGGYVCACASDADCAPYDDADLCNGVYACVDRRCVIPPASVVQCAQEDVPQCWTNQCVPATGLCAPARVPDGRLCDDGDACTTVDTCRFGACTPGARMACDDGDDCTLDTCRDGQCLFTPIPGCGVECFTVEDCLDEDPCTVDRCDAAGRCVHEPVADGGPCEDGDPCTGGDTCQAGVCRAGAWPLCGGECIPAETLVCGGFVEDVTWGFDSNWAMADYACLDDTLDGPEVSYVFTAQSAFTATARLTGGSGLKLLLLDVSEAACDPLLCIASAPAGVPLRWAVEAGATYVLVVDSEMSAAGEFSLSLSCASGEICDNGLDDDGDGDTDCDDRDCLTHPACTESDCRNGIDDDGDGLTDCDDFDCVADAHCLPESDCGDGLDNDFDGATDCADEDCAEDPRCLPESDCHNGIDDDFDGLTDCHDREDCGPAQGCEETNCGNGVDDDRDGLTDCDDDDCAGTDDCTERWCANRRDDDGDGLTDCDDDDCADDPACHESQCNDAIDNDRDGLTDCDDDDCFAIWPCSDFCLPVDEIACGTVLLGESTQDGQDAHSTYGGCGAALTFDGPERVYGLLAASGRPFTVTLRPEAFDGALVLLDGVCRPPLACRVKSDSGGRGQQEVLTFHPERGRSYFVVVEGVGGERGRFDLHVSCPGSPETVCDNGVDDDFDGSADCRDPDCALAEPCRERDCANGLDDNGNGLVDCADPSCALDPSCGEWNCANGVDDDGDGATDCQDSECRTSYLCVEDCANGVDDDGDGLTDCADPSCLGHEDCGEDCDSGRDEDGDGLVDCADPDCVGAPHCSELDCANGVDDDGDGATDCADLDCVAAFVCREFDCANGVDDDGDGLTDCADPDCAGSPDCGEALCENGLDDDGDGWVDCADADCAEDPACALSVCRVGPRIGCGGLADQSFGDPLATDLFDTYPATCEFTGADLSGPERAYELVAPCAGVYDLAVRPVGAPGGYYTVFLLDGAAGCHPAACRDIGYGTASGAELSFEAFEGDRLTVLVDGVAGYDEPFDIELDCSCTPTIETLCDDGWDEDGDGALDCQDEDCADSPLCREGCVPRAPIACGETLSGRLEAEGGEGALFAYPTCDILGLDYGAAEQAHLFVAPCTGPVTVTTTRTSGEGYLESFVLREDAAGLCLAGNCIADGHMGASGISELRFGALAGAGYYLVVDAEAGTEGDYTLSVRCGCQGEGACANGLDDDGDGLTDCADPDCADAAACTSVGLCAPIAVLGCGETVVADTSVGGEDRVDAWGCRPSLDESGPEHVYRWVAERSGHVRIELAAQGPWDLDLFVLRDQGGGCRAEACLESSTTYGDESVLIPVAAGRTYYLVVDGFEGAAGAYSLSLDCEPGCAAEASLVCEEPLASTLMGLTTSELDDYSCDPVGEDYSGPERIVSFTSPCAGTVDFHLERAPGATALMDLFLLAQDVSCEGLCEEAARMDGQSGAAALSVGLDEGQTVLLAVDGRFALGDDFVLRADCDACLSGNPCFGAPPLACGQEVSGAVPVGYASEPSFDFYGCSPRGWPGAERVWRFVAPGSGELSVSVEGDPLPGLLVLEEEAFVCDPFRCLTATEPGEAGGVRFSATGGRAYYLVVDREDTLGGDFTLRVDCD